MEWLLVTSVILLAMLLVYVFKSYHVITNLKQVLIENETEISKQNSKQKELLDQIIHLKEQFAHEVLFDSLTNLPGRQMFEDRLQQAIAQSKRYELNFAILCLDLDDFGLINDALGYDVGDELLKEVGKRLTNCIRQVDTISRFAGDEFVILLTQLSKAESVVYVAQRFLNAISQPFKIQDRELFLTASIGIATYPMDGEDDKKLLKNADNALHQAKVKGRNTYQFYRDEMHALSQRELTLHTTVQSANVFKDFRLYYQPKINIDKKQIVSIDAILFWEHIDFGMLPYSDFSRLAENCGRAAIIAEWLLRNACHQFNRWYKEGSGCMAINLSPRLFENTNFVYKISQILQEINMESKNLIIEISEKQLMNKTEHIEKGLNMLKHLGVRVGIVDFGVGHLSLQQLHHLPIDYVKIANELVKDVTVNKESEVIIKMIIALAKSLTIDVVAEGVSTSKQMELLKELGCLQMQGELFCPPLRANDFNPRTVKMG